MSSNRRFSVGVVVIALGLVLLLLTPSAQASVYYWDTSTSSGYQAGNGTWSTSTSYKYWSTNGTTLTQWSTSGTNDADFYTSGTSAVTVSGSISVHNITFDGSGYTLSGGTLSLTGSITTNQSATIGSILGGTNGLTKAGAGALILTGANTYSGQTTISVGTLQVGNGSTTGSINGTSGVSDSGVLAFDRSDNITFSLAISGNGGLVQAGNGTLTLTNSNPYSGGTTISAGTLQLNNANAAQNSTVTVGSVNGLAFGPGVSAPTVGGLAGSGNVNLATTDASPLLVLMTVGGNNSSTTYSGALSGSGSLTKGGSGALVLTGSNTYSGQTTISSGTLQLGSGGTTGSIASTSITDNGVLEFDRSDSSITFSQAVSGTGGLVQAGIGTLILTGSNTYSGSTTITPAHYK